MKSFFNVLFFLLLALLIESNASVDYTINSSAFYFGARGSRMDWKDGCCNTYTGYLVGPIVGGDYRPGKSVYGAFRAYWMYGHIKDSYKKKYQNFDGQLRLGYTFGETILFSPYTGLGFDQVKLKTEHLKGPCRETSYNSLYVPVGALLSYHPSSTFSVAIDYQYLSQVDSYSKIKGFQGIAFDLSKHGQHAVELPIQFCYPHARFKNIQYRIVPFYRTYFYGSSKVVCSCDCVSNTISTSSQKAHEWGVRYEVAFW